MLTDVRRPVCVITGTRNRAHRHDVGFQMATFAGRRNGHVLFVVGDATGVDDDAWQWCLEQKKLGSPVEFVKESVNKALPSPHRFHERNQRMSEHGGRGDWCLAFPDADSRGTWDCAKRCSKRGMRVLAEPEPEEKP